MRVARRLRLPATARSPAAHPLHFGGGAQSGTTGNPKGVLISHKAIGCLIAATVASDSALGAFVKPGFRYLAYLPLAHIMELAVEIALMASGFSIGYGGVGTITPTAVKMLHPNQLGDAQALKPDILVAAPAVLDKVYKGVTAKFAAMKPPHVHIGHHW